MRSCVETDTGPLRRKGTEASAGVTGGSLGWNFVRRRTVLRIGWSLEGLFRLPGSRLFSRALENGFERSLGSPLDVRFFILQSLL